MPLPFEVHSRTDDNTRSVVRLIAAGGIERVTMRAVAAGAGLSLGSVTNQLTTRERMLRVCGGVFLGWRLTEVRRRLEAHGVAGALPVDDEALALTRVELAWREEARRDENLAYRLGQHDADLRYALAQAAGPSARGLSASGPDAAPLADALLAVVLGLWDSRCRAHGPMSPEAAQLALAAAASAFARSSPTIASGSAAE